MRLENAVAADVLERILSAYGFTMQKELSDKLGIAKSNVASWLQRGQVPGNVLVQCALDTGTDVRWLVTGEFANANIQSSNRLVGKSPIYGRSLIKKMLETGGKTIVHRIMETYGFKTQKELSEYLGISTATISTWIRRDFFPGDVVIACAIDCDKPVASLVLGGQGSSDSLSNDIITSRLIEIKKGVLVAGKILNNGSCYIDRSFLSENINFKNLQYIRSGKKSWFIEMGVFIISNGYWLLDVDGVWDVYLISRHPGNKLKVIGDDSVFECSADDVTPKGMVASIFVSTI